MNTRKLFLWVNIGLIAAIAVSAVFLGLTVVQGPAPAKVPQGVPYNVLYVSPTQIKVEFGNFSQPVNFSDMVLEITSPYGDKSKADVKNSTTEYVQSTALQSLSSIRISSPDLMEKGTSFTMLNYKNLQVGPWAFKLTHKGTGQHVSGGTIIVPDVDTTPKGSFSGLKMTSANEARLELGAVTPSTWFTYCYVEAWGPNMTTTTLYLNDTTSMKIQMEDGTLLTIVDSNKDGLINTGDYASLQTIGREISKGQWSIEVKYSFTKENIANAVFNIT